MPVTREEALWAYRMILGREPENEDVLKQSTIASRSELREQFLGSAEFASTRPDVVVGLHLDEKVDHVDPSVTPDQLDQMLRGIAAAWKSFGEEEPYWSVLTDDQYKKDGIEKRLNSFYKSGDVDVERAVASLLRNGVDCSKIRRVTDFGCGVGRLSLALAKRFPDVTGVDVSEPHLVIAREQASVRNIRNVSFTAVQSIEALGTLPECDFLMTIIVLQHNPPPIIAATLRRLLGRVAPGGYAYFQLPTYISDYSFDATTYLANTQPQMEMNALPQRHVFSIARTLGFEVLEVRENLMAGGPRVVSQVFLLRRPA